MHSRSTQVYSRGEDGRREFGAAEGPADPGRCWARLEFTIAGIELAIVCHLMFSHDGKHRHTGPGQVLSADNSQELAGPISIEFGA